MGRPFKPTDDLIRGELMFEVQAASTPAEHDDALQDLGEHVRIGHVEVAAESCAAH